MTKSRRFLMPLIAVALIGLTACGTASSMLPQPQKQTQAVYRTPQDDVPHVPK